LAHVAQPKALDRPAFDYYARKLKTSRDLSNGLIDFHCWKAVANVVS